MSGFCMPSPSSPLLSAPGASSTPAKRMIDDVHMVAALLVVADRALDQGGDAAELVGLQLLPHRLAVRALAVLAIDQHGEADPLDLRLVVHQRAHGLADLVIRRLFLPRSELPAWSGWPAFAFGRLFCTETVWLASVRLAVVRHVLRAAHHLAVRIVFLLRLARLVEAHLDRGLGAHAARAERALQHLLHRAGQAELGGAAESPPCSAPRRRGRSAAPARASTLPRLSMMAMFCGLSPGTAAATRLRTACTPSRSMPRGARHGEQHARLRLRLLARERLAPRQHEMHAHAAHPVDHADAARELALQRAGLVDVLLELARGQPVAAVEDLVADRAAGGQARPWRAAGGRGPPGRPAPGCGCPGPGPDARYARGRAGR